MNKVAQNKVYYAHVDRFVAEPQTYWAPGRINLIGEHIDYNGGLVLPGAVNLGTYIAISHSNEDLCQFNALDINQVDSCCAVGTGASLPWMRYFTNVLVALDQKGIEVMSVNCSFGGNLPIGAGMSSSSALTCGFVFALNDLFQFDLSLIELVNLASIAEHAGGVDGGKMDQYSIIFGQKDHLMAIDTKTPSHRLVMANFGNCCLLLFNSGVAHDLKSTAYNDRRNDCTSGLQKLHEKGIIASTVCELSISDINENQECLSEDEYSRLTYAVYENQRVSQAIEALENGDINMLGSLLYQSHDGLRLKYDVSCEELDFLVKLAEDSQYILGARMMGGGFGGCTINIVQEQHKKEVIDEIQSRFSKKYKTTPNAYSVTISDGIRKLPVL